MANYNLQISWSSKDNLSDSDPAKIISGNDFQTEFEAVQTAVNSKADQTGNSGQDFAVNNLSVAGSIFVGGTAITSTPAELNILDGVTATASEINDVVAGKEFLDEDDMASDSDTGIPSQQSVKAYVDNNKYDSDDLKTDLNATGSAPVYAARAWVNFNGTGTPAIRESGNVSSVTDTATGVYTVSLTTALVDANASVHAMATENGGNDNNAFSSCHMVTSSTARIAIVGAGSNYYDSQWVSFAVFR